MYFSIVREDSTSEKVKTVKAFDTMFYIENFKYSSQILLCGRFRENNEIESTNIR